MFPHAPPLNKKRTILWPKKDFRKHLKPYFRSVFRHFGSNCLALRSYLRKRFAPGPPPAISKNGHFSLSDESWKCTVLSPWGFSRSGAPFWGKTRERGGGGPRKPFWEAQGPLLQALSLSLHQNPLEPLWHSVNFFVLLFWKTSIAKNCLLKWA